ncbi:MAG: hypothetical protein HYV97_06280 [Bdellovibrio sp.]|nr:hypothetical protein [Bdellovibrio sp.]
MKFFFKRFRYPLLGSMLVVVITAIYLNATLLRTNKILASTSLSEATVMLLSKIQANLDRMYINNNAYFINGPTTATHANMQNVIANPFFRSGLENILYWNVLFKRAAWLDAYCIDRLKNCGPTKACSCLTQQNVVTQLKRDYYHLFNAQDLYSYKTLNIAGCTGAARVFMDLAQKFPLNTSIRYVTTVKYEANNVDPQPNDVYIHACPQQGARWSDYNQKMNGHQVVAIQMPNGLWRLLNTSRPQISWARVPSTNAVFETSLFNLVSNTDRRIDVIFPGMPADSPIETYTVTAAGVDDVTTHNRLMNKYASGNINDAHCQWPAW